MKLFPLLLVIALSVAKSGECATCGNGITCTAATIALSNANDSAAGSPLVVYTATGQGAKITAVTSYVAGVSSGAQSATVYYVIKSGVNTPLFVTNVSPLAATNQFLASSIGGGWPTDENGNAYIFIGPGESFGIGNAYGIPASGLYSGTYYFTVFVQQY